MYWIKFGDYYYNSDEVESIMYNEHANVVEVHKVSGTVSEHIPSAEDMNTFIKLARVLEAKLIYSTN